jgi:hypothetical protein
MDHYQPARSAKRVGDLFAVYRERLVPPQASVERACVKVVAAVVGIELTEAQVSYTVSTKTVSVQIPSVMKSELRFYQEIILAELRRELGERGAPQYIR